MGQKNKNKRQRKNYRILNTTKWIPNDKLMLVPNLIEKYEANFLQEGMLANSANNN